MTGKTVTRADLAESVFRKVGLSRAESAELVSKRLSMNLQCDRPRRERQAVVLATFQVRDKNERIGRNPKSG